MSNSSSSSKLVLAVINFIYLLISVVLLFPIMYYVPNSTSSFTSAYGFASSMYSLGALYGAFEKILSSLSLKRWEKIINIVVIALVIIHMALVVIYYAISYNVSVIWASYICICCIAGIAFFQAVVATIIYSKEK